MAPTRSEPIAVVGSGCRFPGTASSPSALWDLIKTPRDVCQEIPPTRFDTRGHYHIDGTHHGTTNVRHAYLMPEESMRAFDAGFFNISPHEADSMDPQQRLLLETVYEALERGGHAIEKLAGSDTAVYVGTMGVDYNDALLRDLASIPTYFATGTNRAIISNRVSYFFDWHGPSMTIDTACSSSLIAVHQGVQALRTGDARVAVACGTQVILGPEVFIFESKMKMLSPTGRSRMWDASADGYARGEGVAAVVLKRLSDAIADGDHIECIVRETGANQDGFSNGITVPSTEAQAALIRKTYRNAGLDPANNVWDGPQFFEAHGTGTKAGDPKEAAAIAQCFGRGGAEKSAPLYVGSVKTVIGHTEGAAGLAGLLKASGIVQKGFVPPNLLFEQLNPAIEKFYKGLEVPTALKPWPALPEGVPRRVSVNSFGFGGSNAHAIIEQYIPEQQQEQQPKDSPVFTPFLFSAVSEGSLVAQLEAYSTFLKAHPDTNPADLAWTLQSRRSHFPYKVAFSAGSAGKLVAAMDEKLESVKRAAGTTVGLRSNVKSAPRVLGVFTGQGAQWPAMGAELIRSSEFVRGRIQELEDALASLPEGDRPQWKLRDEMLAGADTSRIAEAALSQPLCTAVQVVLVDLLRAAGVTFSAVVGHSSGEIGAAYAAGFLSARDAIRVAYYRGVYARLAGNASRPDQKGAMMAVGTSWEDAEELVNLRAFRGRIAIAAHNSAASVTLSGDADAIAHAKRVFDEEKKFARLLKVDTAYHSRHMLPCGGPYVEALRACGVKINRERPADSPAWFSSVKPGSDPVEPSDELDAEYWRDNMVNAVLFADAVKNAVASDPGLTYALEVGPHPALKGPATQNAADVRPAALPYSGVLSRGKNDVDMVSEALGFIWTQVGSQGVDFSSYRELISGSAAVQPRLIVGLPSYQWNHSRPHWFESRRSRKIRGRSQAFHELLGAPCPDSTERERRWNNVLKVSEIPWLEGHQLQGQCVFPAAGYVALALESSRLVAGERPVQVIEVQDLNIPRAITFEDDSNAGVETLVTLTGIRSGGKGTDTTVAEFSCYSCPSNGTDQEMELMASARVKIVYGESALDVLASRPLDTSTMADVDVDHFYSSLGKLGYGYAGPFRTMSATKRRLNQASVQVLSHHYADDDATTYLVHPTWLDVAFQASMLAYSAPGDERLWSLHVPTSIRSIRINPGLCASLPLSSVPIPVSSVLAASDTFSASIDLFTEDGERALVQVEDLTIKPFAPATEADDRRLFSHTKIDVASPDGKTVVGSSRPTEAETELAVACERLSYYYVRKWKAELTDEDWTNGQEHHLALRDYVEHVLETAASGNHPCLRKEWVHDTREDMLALVAKHGPTSTDIRLLSAVGEQMPASVRGETTILEHMLPNNLLDDFYKQGLGFTRYNDFLAGMMRQLVHRYPHSRILEIGAGTGGATKAVLDAIGTKYSSYTYTDVSVGFFEKAAELFRSHRDKMTFRTLDIEKTPASQGYEPGSYDVIVASNVLHATTTLDDTLRNARQLLRPGGYLMLLEITGNGPIRFSNIMGGLPGWWAGVGDGRKYAPTVTPGEWHAALRRTGYSGVDSITPEVDALAWPLSIIAAQAVDDKVNFLRRPLASSGSSSASLYIDSLVILGGATLQTAQLTEDLSEQLARFCGSVTILPGLPTENDAQRLLDISPMSTFINLVDLDAPIFKGVTDPKMDGLRRLYELAGHLLWVTRGALVDNPYHMASITFSRAMSHEAGHISMNHLDVSQLGDDQGLARGVAEHLLRQCALDEWETPTSGGARQVAQRQQKMLWSREPEAFLDGEGKLRIPRLVDRPEQNARLNSSRRNITRAMDLDHDKGNVSVVLAPNEAPIVTQDAYLQVAKDGQRRVRVEASSLMALRVASDAQLYLSVGKDIQDNTSVVALSETNSRDTVALACIPETRKISADQLLVSVLNEILAASIAESLPSGSSLVVHCSNEHRLLASALSRRAAALNIRVTVTYDSANAIDAPESVSWIGLDARAPRHVVGRQLLPAQATHLLDLTVGAHGEMSELSISINHVLPAGYRLVSATDFARHASLLPKRDGFLSEVTCRLKDAISNISVIGDVNDLLLNLEQLHDPSTAIQPTSAIRWPVEGQVKVHVRPLDAKRLFSRDKTYLLVGLTGQIGQSLCEWMVANGAGYVCLTSRSPKIEQSWLDSFKDLGAVVKVFSLDITDKTALTSLLDTIRSTCPPIAGVANGAMVLHDCLFSNMSAAVMQKVLGPKIDGSNNLDEAFADQALDFFVLFSSSACVIGNSGQSNYAAANGYLNALARRRRRRGLAASTFDIGRVAGIGYVETAGQAVMDQLERFGLMAISETELRQMFAETIYAGFPSAGEVDAKAVPEAVVTTGIRTIRDDEEIQGPWFENPLFSHCIIEAGTTEADSGSQGKKNALPVTEQLARATSKEEALDVMMQCFSARLTVILQLGDGTLDPETSLVELGVDSLVAVEIRSWFLKELKVDIPVLKIVGGASVSEICERALEKLPEDLLASSTGGSAPAPPATTGELAKPAKVAMPSKPTMAQIKTRLESGISTPGGAPTSSSGSDYNSESRIVGEQPTPTTQLSSRSTSPDRKEKSPSPTSTSTPPFSKTATKEPAKKTYLKSELISFGQSRFWFLRLLLDDPTTSNVAFYYHIAGPLRVGDLERAVRVVTARHESLRTCFVAHETDPDQAYQKVLHASPIRLKHKKIASVDEVPVEYAKIQSHAFDLSSGELMDLVLLSLSPTSHYLLVNYHHIVMDGVSFQVFLADLEKAYTGKPLGPAPRQFPDYSRAQRNAFEAGEMNEELAYWRGVFPPGEQPPVLPLLPMARTSSRSAMRSFGVHQVSTRLSAETMAHVRAVSKAQRATPFHFTLAAYKAMLFSFAEVDDLTIGIADANRNDGDVMASVGFFLNLLTLRFARRPSQRFSDAVSEARDVTYAALGHSRLPFDVLLQELGAARSSAHSPFFQAFFDYRQGAQEKHPWGNTQFEFQEVHPGRTAYDLTLDVTVGAEDALVMMRVQKGLYDETAANLLLDTYVHFLDVLSRNAALTLEKTPLFGEKQLSRATQVGRGPALKSDWLPTLPLRIDQMAQEHPNNIALVDDSGKDLSYAAMVHRIEAIAEILQQSSVTSGSRVLVFQTAASDWVCSMLAIMRIGAVYVPLDLRNPLPRLSAVAVDCEPAAVLADDTTVADAPQLNVPQAVTINVSTLPREPSSPVANVSEVDSPAAVLYTSGSTGTPKGITVTHAGLRNEIEGYTKTWGLGAERVLQQSAFTFNHSSDQIYTGLANGGTVHIVPSYKRGDPLEITALMRRYNITYTKATPSEYLLWMQFGADNLRHVTSWERAFGGGENMSTLVTEQFAALNLPNLRVFNSYGPTEISISSTKMELDYRNIDNDAGRIPCGFSLPNYYTYVVDEQLRPLPVGMPGELCIGGAGVSRGYFKNDALTDKHFVSDPFATTDDVTRGWTRMYRTGDIGHLRDDGAMVFHRRMAGDNQVKIRGLRIELDDIESNILTTAAGALREAVVTLREAGDSSFLVAHVVFSPNSLESIPDKESFLANVLARLPVPQYMIPALAVPLENLPLTNHSKVDRKAIQAMALPVRVRSVDTYDGQEEPMSATMVQLQPIWKSVLNSDELGLDITSSSNFFLVGGNSLLVIRLQARIRQTFNVTIPLVDLLGSNTLGRMARKIDESIKVELIDWEQEIAPPVVPDFLQSVSGPAVGSQETKTVLVTGATGFLAKYILPRLIEDPTVGKIHCVAVREKQQQEQPRLSATSDKLVQHQGDLTLPLLGLSKTDFQHLSSNVDVILHMGASRSFWDSYHVLRAANVDSTRELVKLATPRGIPIHYMSSVGVMPRESIVEASAAAYPPSVDSSGGYVATRWASEQILERSSEELGMPVRIHRFLPASNEPLSQAVLDDFLSLVDESGVMPDMAGWEGRMDMTDAAKAAEDLRNALLLEADEGQVRFEHHESGIVVRVNDLRTHLEEHRGQSGLKHMPGLQWIGRIKKLGFGYLLTGQDVVVGTGDAKFESRR